MTVQIEKYIKITASNKVVPSRSTTSHLWRSWRVQVRSTEGDGRAPLATYVDHVEYRLHESFVHPRVVCRKEPYVLEQEGWGEFDLAIVFYFKHALADPQTLWLDLHFQKPKYSVYKALVFRHPRPEWAHLLRTRLEKKSTPKKEATPPNSRGEVECCHAIHAGQGQKKKQAVWKGLSTSSGQDSLGTGDRGDQSPLPDGVTRKTDRRNQREDIPEEVNVENLAGFLQSLDDDALREVYHMLAEHNTSDMFIVETEAEVFLDLYSLGPTLLSKLWEFSTSTQQELQKKRI